MRHALNFLLHRLFESLLMALPLLFPRFGMLFARALKVLLDLHIVLGQGPLPLRLAADMLFRALAHHGIALRIDPRYLPLLALMTAKNPRHLADKAVMAALHPVNETVVALIDRGDFLVVEDRNVLRLLLAR